MDPLLNGILDIKCDDSFVIKVNEFAYKVGIMDVSTAFSMISKYMGMNGGQLRTIVTKDNALEVVQEQCALTIVNLACAYHKSFLVPFHESGIVVRLNQSSPPELHLKSAERYFEDAERIAKKYGIVE